MVMFYEQDDKQRKTERTLIIRLKEGQKPKSTTGMVDSRIFQGKENVLAVMDEQTCLWRLRYRAGILPEPLLQQFTSFEKLMKFAREYFGKRGMDIVDVKD